MAATTQTESQTPPAIEIRPQEGPQSLFLSTSADVAIYGGAAGGGKSYGLLLEPLRHINVPGFGAVIFRRTSPQIRNKGGLWDTSIELFLQCGATPYESTLEWDFPVQGVDVKFAHMQYESNKHDWQGSQIPLIGWDELTHFTETQFFYMLSRNRSTCGVEPYMRATCNPDADSWVAELISWWIDQETGYPIPERSGVLRYFIRINDVLDWGDSRSELAARHADFLARIPGVEAETLIKSLTFISSNVYDNKILLSKDPGYLANLLAQPTVEMERLLKGNWKIRAEAGKVFNRAWFEIVEAVPAGGGQTLRFWDLAGTEKKLTGKGNDAKDPDYTAGVKILQHPNGFYYILDVVAEQIGPAEGDETIKNTATQDGTLCPVRWEEEGGASGKRDSAHLVNLLRGFDCQGIRPQGDKLVRARALAAQAKAGNVKLLRASWNERFLKELHNQPDAPHDDIMDAAAGAFNELTSLIVWNNW